MKFLTFTSLMMICTISANANMKYSTYQGKAELFTPSVPEEMMKIVGTESTQENLSSMIFIQGKNIAFLEELVSKALKKSSKGHPQINVMYTQTYPEVNYDDLSLDQKKFFNLVTSDLSGAFVQINIDESEESIICEKRIEVDMKNMRYDSFIGCYFPAPVETGVRQLIETKFDQINLFTKDEVIAMKAGDFPDYLMNDPEFLKLANKYGETIVSLGLGSKKYRFNIETTIADGKIILRPYGNHLTSSIDKMLPLSKDDKDFQQNFRYLENTTFFKNQNGNIICSRSQSSKNESVIFLNNSGNKASHNSCMYVIDISKYLNQLL